MTLLSDKRMATAELQIVEFINDGGSKIPVLAQCTLCPYPKVFFDTQGKVVEMHPASGNPLLLIAAMEALRHWKYEPTILGGEAYPVRLLVTITFELQGW